MTSIGYMQGRKKYSRPQAMIWADNPGTLITDDETGESFYVPTGYEVGAAAPDGTSQDLLDTFLILSDDNRQPISFNTERIEQRQRTINGRMRSYHIADKINLSSGWNMLPSRSYSSVANFNTTSDDASVIGKSDDYRVTSAEYTTDGGAGGMEILDWYNTHQGSFWVFLSYDNYKNLGLGDYAFQQLYKYSQVVEVFFSDFSYSVEKRGGSTYDFWNISFALEEV